jgi:selenocysteine lyase/cysteine desulfurase
LTEPHDGADLVVGYLRGDQTADVSEMLDNQRHLFEIPDDVSYFNLASLAPQLRAVRAAGEAALAARAAPWHVSSDDWFTEVEHLRALFADVISGDADGVALIPATSYGMAIAAHDATARPGERIALIADDYPSTVYTWRAFASRHGAEIVTVTRAADESWTDAVLGALDERVRVVSVPNVRWTDGALIDLERVGARARELGALLAVDLTQSLGAMPFDVSAVRPDFLVATGYKWLLGPFSVAYLWVAPEHRSRTPLEHNWINRAGSQDFARLTDYRDDFQPGARRFDVGQRTNFTLTPMAIAALGQVLDWRIDRTAATLQAITGRIEDWAREHGLRPLAARDRGPHMLEVGIPPDAIDRVRASLAENNVFVGVRGAGGLRVSPHLYTTDDDLERLFDALTSALSARS